MSDDNAGALYLRSKEKSFVWAKTEHTSTNKELAKQKTALHDD